MSETSNSNLRLTAILYATRPDIVDHVRRFGTLPNKVEIPGAPTAINVLARTRGPSYELRPEERLVHDALLRDRSRKQESDSARSTPVAPKHELSLVYGSPADFGLIFMEAEKAHENLAFHDAQTWGELKVAAPALYEDELFRYGLEDSPPNDGEFLRRSQDRPLYPHFPSQLMLDLIPEDIQEKYGTVAETVSDGPILVLDPAHEQEIVEGLLKYGFTCKRDERLFDLLYS